jgi:DNA polymerase I
MSIKKEKLIIIDGNALIHRSFHALPQTLTTKDGTVVNAVYGFASVLLKALRDFKPDYIVLTFDRKEPTFRHKEYKEYKANRTKAPQELYDQIPIIKKLVEAFGIPIYEKAGFEADDLIGTISRKIDGDTEKIIVTGDMDTLQLINSTTKVYTMSRGIADSILYDEVKVKERYGLTVEQLIDYKALRGDPSDNIPGVKGIGDKTAVHLLQNFKNLDGVYKNIDSEKIKERIKGLLLDHQKEAYLSKKLGTIITDVDLEFSLPEAHVKKINTQKVVEIFSELEFKSLLPRLYEITGKEKTNNKIPQNDENKFERNLRLFNYNLVKDKKGFDLFIKELEKQKEFAFDTETTSFDPISAELIGISFSWNEKEAYYLRFIVSENKEKDLFNFDEKEEGLGKSFLEELRPIFEDKARKKIGHNIKYDIEVMNNYDIKVNGDIFDTRVASYILNPGNRQHNLDAITFSHFGIEKINKDDLFPDKKKGINFKDIPIEKIYNYSCEDADFTFRLYKKLGVELKEQNLKKLFYDIEMPLLPVLVKMELNGVKIDTKFLHQKSQDFKKRIDKITNKVYKLAGVEFNVNSTKQLREILFDKLEIPTQGIKRGKTGLSTSADELKKIKDIHPIVELIQENRELVKLKNTYIDALPALVIKKTKRVHTSFNQTATATGRLSSNTPNLQNIPVRTIEGREIRRAFIAEKNYKLLALDYSQIELRVAASMSGDKKMIKAFNDSTDIHSQTAAEINNVKSEEVTKEMRREAKAINFGILYGQGPHGLSQSANIPYATAQEFIEAYFKAFSGVRKFIDKVIKDTKDNGYVETLFGRRRYLADINSNTPMIRKAAERMAINTPIQGTAADMIKLAMVEVQELIDDKYKTGEVKMIVQVHDELIFEVKKDLVKKLAEEIREIMESIIKLKVPVVVDAKLGDNWEEMEKI